MIYRIPDPIFPESASEGFLLCTSSAGAELSFPLRCRRVAGELPPQIRRIENVHFPEENHGFWCEVGVEGWAGGVVGWVDSIDSMESMESIESMDADSLSQCLNPL